MVLSKNVAYTVRGIMGRTRKNDTLQLIVRIYEFEAAESKNYKRRRRCNGRDCDGQRRQLWGCGGSFKLQPWHPNGRRYNQKDEGSTKRLEKDEGGNRGGRNPS